MSGNFEKVSRLITDEFQDHIDQTASLVKDGKDFEKAIHEAIEVRIGRIHNVKIWGGLAEVYADMLRRKLDNPAGARKASRGVSHADQVRKYCKDKIVDPARDRGEKQIAIRAGDIHSAMGYRSRMPLVCAALGAEKFEEVAGVKRVDLSGPTNGANAVFTFRIK